MTPLSPFRSTRCPSSLVKAGVLCAALGSAPAFAATYTEVLDAGQTQATAQSTLGIAGALSDVFGTLDSSTDADLYVINITSPSTFRASTLNAIGGSLDTQLFLMTLAGAPIFFNDDDAGGLSALSTLATGAGLGPLTAGSYLLGVAASGYNPVNVNSQLLYASGDTTTVHGPASGLQPAVLGGFFDSTYFVGGGRYDIQLTGVGAIAAAVPEPSSALLLAIGGAALGFGAARRRRGAGTASAA